MAKNVTVNVSLKNNQIRGLTFTPKVDVGNIYANETKDVTINLSGGMNLQEALAEFKIEVMEEQGFDAYPLEMKIETARSSRLISLLPTLFSAPNQVES